LIRYFIRWQLGS